MMKTQKLRQSLNPLAASIVPLDAGITGPAVAAPEPALIHQPGSSNGSLLAPLPELSLWGDGPGEVFQPHDGGSGKPILPAPTETVAVSGGEGTRTISAGTSEASPAIVAGDAGPLPAAPQALITPLSSGAESGAPAAMATALQASSAFMTEVQVSGLSQEATAQSAAATSGTVLTIAVGTSAQDVNIIIDGAAAGDIIEFQDGIHIFDRTIIIQRSDITLRGESSTGTHIVFDFDADNNGIVTTSEIDIANNGVKIKQGDGAHGFAIYGFQASANKLSLKDKVNASETVSLGDTSIIVASITKYSVGDVIYISKDNTPEYLDALGGKPTSSSYDSKALGFKFREFITKITAIDAATKQITFADAMPYDMADVTGEFEPTTVQRINQASQNVTISNLDITYEVGPPAGLVTPDAYNFTNTQTGFSQKNGAGQGYAAIYLEGTYSATLSNITVNDAPSYGFDIRNSSNLTATDLSVEGSFNKGKSGNGYGVQLYETSNSDLSDLNLQDMRHAFLFSAWHAETGNSVQITNANRDINFHGGPDHSNVVTVDQLVLDYNSALHTTVSGESGIWPIVSNGSAKIHNQTDIYGNNIVVFGTAGGFDKDEEIFGNDSGSTLNGNGGDDILHGGAGIDQLSGGDGDDILNGEAQADILNGGRDDDIFSGGTGSDVFVFDNSFGNDVITDFDYIDAFEAIDLTAVTNIADWNDLSANHLSQSGADAVITDGAHSITLTGIDSVLLDAGDFIFV